MTPIAVTGDRFAGFGPYVPAVDDDGVVAFQAALVDGGTGVFVGDGDSVAAVAEGLEVRSHPDRDEHGTVWFYTDRALVRVRAGRVEVVAEVGDRFAAIGPLGPTCTGGRVAYRADPVGGEPGIFLDDQTVAAGGWSFEGLPVVTRDGTVVFRGSCARGSEIWAARGGSIEPVALIAELGRFPSASGSGRIAYHTRTAVFVDGEVVVDARAGFASFRGVLVGDEGPVVFYATPIGGRLGVYVAPDRRLTGLGDPLLGSTVTDLALNPVSRSDAGWLALRVALADGREAIVRASPDRLRSGTGS